MLLLPLMPTPTCPHQSPPPECAPLLLAPQADAETDKGICACLVRYVTRIACTGSGATDDGVRTSADDITCNYAPGATDDGVRTSADGATRRLAPGLYTRAQITCHRTSKVRNARHRRASPCRVHAATGTYTNTLFLKFTCWQQRSKASFVDNLVCVHKDRSICH
jgi:hypothetical protein